MLDAKCCHLKAHGGKFVMKKYGIEIFNGCMQNNLYSVRNLDSIGANNNFSYYANNSKPSLKEIQEKYGHTVVYLKSSHLAHLQVL
jgi:hypothetical protein